MAGAARHRLLLARGSHTVVRCLERGILTGCDTVRVAASPVGAWPVSRSTVRDVVLSLWHSTSGGVA